MQQIWIPRAGPTTVLEVREAPDPEPGPGEVRVRVEAAGVNFADLMARQGTYPDAPPFPCVVGYEVAGVVDAVGEGVDTGWIGEPVACATKFGGYSDVVCVNEVQVARRRGLDAVAAASLPVVGLILSALILREKVTRHRWMTVVIGFVGVLIILRPGFAVFDVMALVVFLSALAYAGGDISTKMLSRTEPSRLIVLNLNIWLIAFAAIPTALNWHTPAWSDLPLILIMGGTAWAAHMCLAQAMKCAEASVVIPFEFVRLPITAFAAYVFFAEVPGVWALVGAGVIFFGTWRLAAKEGGH